MPATMPPQVLQIAAYGDPFLHPVDADFGVVRSVGRDPLDHPFRCHAQNLFEFS